MSSYGPCPTSIFLKAWCWELDTKLQLRLYQCQIEHNKFFCGLHKTLLQVFSLGDVCFFLCCGQTIPRTPAVSGCLKSVGASLHAAAWQVTVHKGCRLGLFAGDFCIWHSPLKWLLLSSSWFLSIPLGFSGSIWIQTLSSYGKWYRWLVYKVIIYLSLDTKRVANWLHGLVLERQEELV